MKLLTQKSCSRTANRRGWARPIALGGWFLLAALPGCNAPPAAAPLQSVGSPSSGSVFADWDDVEPAVRAIGFSTPAVLLSIEPATARARSFLLATAGDDLVTLTVTRDTDDNLTTINLLARAEPLGDVVLEQRIVAAVKKRLERLRGVSSAPLEGYE